MKTKPDFQPGTLFKDKGLLFRIIRPDEIVVLKQATEINNLAWGSHLKSSLDDFRSRAINGYLIGAFKNGELAGTLSGIGGSNSLLNEARGTPGHPYNTWDGITSNGTFTNPSSDPDIMFCVAVTTAGTTKRPYPTIPDGDSVLLDFARGLADWKDREDTEFNILTQKSAAKVVENYCRSGLDYVIKFQERPKARGLFKGAEIITVLQNGRPADMDSFGYNVLMRYPETPSYGDLPEHPRFLTIGEGLVVAAAYLASAHPTIRFVMPYSRPAQFRANMIKALVATATNKVNASRPGFGKFARECADAVLSTISK